MATAQHTQAVDREVEQPSPSHHGHVELTIVGTRSERDVAEAAVRAGIANDHPVQVRVDQFVANAQAGGVTRLYSFRAFLSTPLSPFTSFSGGARYQDSHSDIADSYREAAVYVSLAYTFH